MVSKLPSGSLVDADGKPSPQLVAYLQKIEKLANAAPDLSGVTVPDEANTTATTTTRVVNDSLNGVAGTDPGTDPIGLGNSGGTTVNDSFTRLANILNAQYLNDANLAAAIVTLSDRLNAALAVIEELRAAIADE